MGPNYWSGGGRWSRDFRLFVWANVQLPEAGEQVDLIVCLQLVRRVFGIRQTQALEAARKHFAYLSTIGKSDRYGFWSFASSSQLPPTSRKCLLRSHAGISRCHKPSIYRK
jgi:hypothetical protein